MHEAKRIREREETDLLTHSPLTFDDSGDGPEFSSEPMPAAFAACLFLAVGLVVCVLLVFFFW